MSMRVRTIKETCVGFMSSGETPPEDTLLKGGYSWVLLGHADSQSEVGQAATQAVLRCLVSP